MLGRPAVSGSVAVGVGPDAPVVGEEVAVGPGG
jgi:hypothetical protein